MVVAHERREANLIMLITFNAILFIVIGFVTKSYDKTSH